MSGTDEDEDPAAAALARAAALRAEVAEADDEDDVLDAPEPPRRMAVADVPAPPPVVLPEVNRDPFARANDALRAAREARGAEADDDPLPEVPPIDPRNPFAAAEAALARARQAQESTKGRRGLEREARARSELARLKGGGALTSAPDADGADEEEAPSPQRPKPRRL